MDNMRVIEKDNYHVVHKPDNFHRVDDLDTTKWLTVLDTMTDKMWGEDPSRQENFIVHRYTQTIPLVYDEKFVNPIKTKYYKIFETSLMSLESLLSTHYGKGFTARVILTKLKSKGAILPHRDSGKCFELSHRVHIPLITNDEVFFTVGEDTIVMRSGELWEINNVGQIHSVVNKSDHDRIHLIIDWQPYNYKKET
jgi:hypothetical protein